MELQTSCPAEYSKNFCWFICAPFYSFFSYRLFSRSVPAHHHLARLHSIHSFWATVIFAVLCTAFCIALCVFPACSYITSVKDAKYQYRTSCTNRKAQVSKRDLSSANAV